MAFDSETNHYKPEHEIDAFPQPQRKEWTFNPNKIRIIRGDASPWPRDWYGEGRRTAYSGNPAAYAQPDYLRGYCDEIKAIAPSNGDAIDWYGRLCSDYCCDGDHDYQTDF